MKRMILAFSITLIVLLLNCCKKYEFPDTQYPRIKTLPVTNNNSGSATMNLSIISNGENAIKFYGFEWGQYSKNSFYYSDTISSFLPHPESTLSTDVNRRFVQGSRYVVRAFVTTDTYRVYGDTVIFRAH